MITEEFKKEFEQIFLDWGYGSNSDKEVCKRLLLELIDTQAKTNHCEECSKPLESGTVFCCADCRIHFYKD